MTIDEMKRMARESLELWSSDAKGKAENVFSPNYLNHQEPAAVGGVKGVDLEGWKAIVVECHTAFSDFDVAILTQVAEGDLVATRWQFEGTQTGEYLGRPPDGMRATWAGVEFERFAEGKSVESWVVGGVYRVVEAGGVVAYSGVRCLGGGGVGVDPGVVPAVVAALYGLDYVLPRRVFKEDGVGAGAADEVVGAGAEPWKIAPFTLSVIEDRASTSSFLLLAKNGWATPSTSSCRA